MIIIYYNIIYKHVAQYPILIDWKCQKDIIFKKIKTGNSYFFFLILQFDEKI